MEEYYWITSLLMKLMLQTTKLFCLNGKLECNMKILIPKHGPSTLSQRKAKELYVEVVCLKKFKKSTLRKGWNFPWLICLKIKNPVKDLRGCAILETRVLWTQFFKGLLTQSRWSNFFCLRHTNNISTQKTLMAQEVILQRRLLILSLICMLETVNM